MNATTYITRSGLLVCMLIAIISIKQLYHVALRRNKVILRLSPHSVVIAEELTCFFSNPLNRYASAATCLQTLKQKNRIISAITLNKKKPGIVEASVLCEKPYIHCNNDFIITNEGTYVPATWFLPQELASLGRINIAADSLHHAEQYPTLVTFFKNLPWHVYQEYEITWHNKTTIILCDHKQPTIRIIAYDQTQFSPEIMHAITVIKSIIEERIKKYPKKTKNKNWDIDIRCNKLAILSTHLGVTNEK